MSKNNKLNNEWTGTYIFFARSANGIAHSKENVQKNGSSFCAEATAKNQATIIRPPKMLLKRVANTNLHLPACKQIVFYEDSAALRSLKVQFHAPVGLEAVEFCQAVTGLSAKVAL